MATAAQPATLTPSFPAWFWDFIKSELAPYPGRAATVARITLAVVLSFILVMTFRIPASAITLYMVFTVTRDSPGAAVRSALSSIAAITFGLGVSLMGVLLFIDYPLLHFLFVAGEFGLLFWLVRVLAQPSAATTVGMAAYNASNIWTLAYPAELHLQETLWFWISMSLGSIIAALVEIAFDRRGAIGHLLDGISERLRAVEDLLAAYSRGPVDPQTTPGAKAVMRLAMVGTGQLRRQLRAVGTGRDPFSRYLTELNTVVMLSGRLVDIAAALAPRIPALDDSDRRRLTALADELGSIRRCLLARVPPPRASFNVEPSAALPLLPQLERLVSLIPSAFAVVDENTRRWAPIEELQSTPLFTADKSKPDAIRFALKGCLAAMICYILYTALDWPGISTSVITCLVTALSTLGTSRQKQVLRMAGATFGGLLGIASIVFLIPNMETIAPMVLLVAAVSALGAWVATASPRLSYFGLQTCLAFYLTTTQSFSIPTSLSVARDRFFGVLLGLTVMWVVFDHLWPVRAVDEVQRVQRNNFHLMAKLALIFNEWHRDRAEAIPEIRRLRELINSGFSNVQALAGTVLFEFGPDRARNLLLRNQVLRRQSYLRTIFLLLMALLQYRVELDPSQIPTPVREAAREFHAALSRILESELSLSPTEVNLDSALNQLTSQVNAWSQSPREQAIISLSRQIVESLQSIETS